MSSPEERQLADIIADIQERLERLEESGNQEQLTFSSVENGSLNFYDIFGTLRERLGKQSDGAFADIYVNGDQPPIPTTPVVSPLELAISVYWDGLFAGAATAPSDLQRVDVHMSETPGFDPDGTTVVGSLLDESVLTIPTDSNTKYLKTVAVTTSDVASLPSNEVQSVPLPASHIAAGSIGAEQLAALIVLASVLIVGEPTGERMVVDPATKLLRLFNSNNNEVGFLGANQGYWQVGGGAHFNDETGQYIDMRGGWLEVGEHDFDERVILERSTVNIIEGSNGYLIMGHVFDMFGFFTDNVAGIRGNGAAVQSYGAPIHLEFRSAGGVINPETRFRFDESRFNEPFMLNDRSDVGFVVGNNGIMYVVDTSNTQGREIQASDFVIYSGFDSKVNIRDVPYSSLEVVESAQAKMWERPNDESRTYVGVIAEDIPEELVRYTSNTQEKSLSQTTLVGTLWNAVHELSAKVDALQQEVDTLKGNR